MYSMDVDLYPIWDPLPNRQGIRMEIISKNQELHFEYPENYKDFCTLLPNSKTLTS